MDTVMLRNTILPALALLFTLARCKHGTENIHKKPIQHTGFQSKSNKPDTLGAFLTRCGLVDVQTLNSNIFVQLKYATTDNFMHQNVYGNLKKAYLQKEIAEKLNRSQQKLSSIDSNLHLLVYDAARPLSAQKIMWKLLDSIPVAKRGKFVSNPANGSIHNFGCAVDLTICTPDTVPLDMGAGFDDARLIAYPEMERVFLDSGLLNKVQIKNRRLLRSVMYAGGFYNIQSEWWHFNGVNRWQAKEKYSVIP